MILGAAAAISVVLFWIGMITVTGGILLALGIVGPNQAATAARDRH
jgi:hypothetical protein